MSVTSLLAMTLTFEDHTDPLFDLMTGYYYSKTLCEDIVLTAKSSGFVTFDYFVGLESSQMSVWNSLSSEFLPLFK